MSLSRLRLDRLIKKLFSPVAEKHSHPLDQLMGQARLGISLEEAKNTELYRFLLVRALAEHDEAVEGWLKSDPTDVNTNIALQAQAKRLEALTVWLDEAITAGHGAHLRLKQEEYVDG